jgi:hypothetical protein
VVAWLRRCVELKQLIRSGITQSPSTSINRISSMPKSVQSENGSPTFAPRAPCSRHPRYHRRPSLTVLRPRNSRLIQPRCSRRVCSSITCDPLVYGANAVPMRQVCVGISGGTLTIVYTVNSGWTSVLSSVDLVQKYVLFDD